jgi:branched-chain amino acid transport system substrate-binding protein
MMTSIPVAARRGLALIACGALLVVAACGDDDSDAAAGGASTAGSAGPAGGDRATGDPLKVYVIEDSNEAAGVTFPSVRAGIDARVDRINDVDGGLGGSGRPVEVVYCTTDADPNAAAECAREAVADPEVIAVAGSVSANGDAVLPILEEAGLASVGGTAFSASDGQSPVSFPTMGGFVAAVGCQATVLRDEADATRLGVAYGDTPGADLAVTVADLVLDDSAASVVGRAVVPLGQPDYSAELGAVTDGADGLVMATEDGTAQKIVGQLDQLGADVAVAGTGGQSFNPDTIADLGGATDGLYLALWFASDDMPGDGVAEYVDAMDAAGASGRSDDLSKLGWVAFELLDQAAEGLPTIDRASILGALNAMSAFDTGGLTPVLDFTTPGQLVAGPRFVNDSCVYAQVQDGTVEAISDGFVRPFSAG